MGIYECGIQGEERSEVAYTWHYHLEVHSEVHANASCETRYIKHHFLPTRAKGSLLITFLLITLGYFYRLK